MRVYVIRHGESVNNNLKKWTGWFDAPLTEKGYQDARLVKEFLSGVKIDKVYSSDLSRSIETSKTAMPNREIEITPLLREINLGSMENRPWADMTAEQKERGVAVGYKEFGGETKDEFNARINEFFKILENSGFESVAVFTHGGWLRGSLDKVLGVNLPKSKVLCGNCAAIIYDYNGEWILNSFINNISAKVTPV